MSINSQYWNIRMRASREGKHISGAECLEEQKEALYQRIGSYLERALKHSRGEPDVVHITVERLKDKPIMVEAPPIITVNTKNTRDAWIFIGRYLRGLGVSDRAMESAQSIIKNESMRGAAILTIETSRRLEPDRQRGIRATRMGITREAEEKLHALLKRMNVKVNTVKEALVLASKVARAPYVVAELCVSDNPDYTTGYICSQRGYIRIPWIKEGGTFYGGRVFFVTEDCNIKELIDYLENKPVLVSSISGYCGVFEIEEISLSHS